MMDQRQADEALLLDRQLCFAVYAAAHAFNRAYKPMLEPLGLTYPQYLVMLALWEADQLTVKALGERLGLDSGTLSPLLKRLEQAGTITRRRDPEDERQVRIVLTEAGAAIKSKAVHVANTLGDATGCTLAEIDDLRERLTTLRLQLDAAAR